MKVVLLPGETIDVYVPYRQRVLRCQAIVKTVGSDEVSLSRPSRHRVRPPLAPGKLRLLVRRREGAYVASSDVDRWDLQCTILRGPLEIEELVTQRRVHVRIRIPLNVEIQPLSGGAWLPCLLEDISGGGASLLVHEQLVPRTDLLLRVRLPEMDMAMVRGGVVRSVAFLDQGRVFYRIGVEFDGIASALQSKFVRFVNTQLILHKNTRFVSFSTEYDQHWSDVQYHSEISGKDSRADWLSFRRDVTHLADRTTLQGHRLGLLCSRVLQPRVMQVLGKRSTPPLLLTPDDFMPTMDEVAGVEIFSGIK